MEQIKTVVEPFELSDRFDRKVNSLLSEGWKLKKRTIVSASGEPNEVGSAPVVCSLYAELERYIPPFPEEITL